MWEWGEGGLKSLPESDETYTVLSRVLPCSSDGEESACNSGDPGWIPGSARSPGEGNCNPLQYSFLENPHGQRNLVGYSPWGRKESDTTEGLTIQYSIFSYRSPFPRTVSSTWRDEP